MSLGGVRDEAEIRGHRRTYIGSMPGKIVQNMARTGVRNPLFLLDEVDKMAMDFRGDPSSALLEVLDPEQNQAFSDHYLEVDFDLSEVMFVCTANSLNIPAPLLDRMEVIRIPGYTEDEKASIARRYLLPKQVKANGLRAEEIKVSDPAILEVIRHYTREAGVRNLERELSKICRKSVKELLLERDRKVVSVTPKNLAKYLGVKRFRYGRAEENDQVGQVTGLAWTEVGGELLTIEAAVMSGKGKLTHTGQLGEVMQESIQAAMTVVRSRANVLGLEPEFYQKADVHIHVPEGATPKDGPSAGIGMCTALVSALTKIPVRSDVAMTGEITLRGEVLPIGGLKEKLLAAHRGGIRTVLIPSENVKDLAEIPDNIKGNLEIKAVKWIDEVLQVALRDMPQPTSAEPESTPGREAGQAPGTSCGQAGARALRRVAPFQAEECTGEQERVDRSSGRAHRAREVGCGTGGGGRARDADRGIEARRHRCAVGVRDLPEQGAGGPDRAQPAHRREHCHSREPGSFIQGWQGPEGCTKLKGFPGSSGA
jgi:ATP-dependent Lon protease